MVAASATERTPVDKADAISDALSRRAADTDGVSLARARTADTTLASSFSLRADGQTAVQVSLAESPAAFPANTEVVSSSDNLSSRRSLSLVADQAIPETRRSVDAESERPSGALFSPLPRSRRLIDISSGSALADDEVVQDGKKPATEVKPAAAQPPVPPAANPPQMPPQQQLPVQPEPDDLIDWSHLLDSPLLPALPGEILKEEGLVPSENGTNPDEVEGKADGLLDRISLGAAAGMTFFLGSVGDRRRRKKRQRPRTRS
jgi:hypothetical protein